MKRFMSVVLVAIVAVMLIGCGKSSGSPEGKYVVKTMDGKTLEETFKEEAGDVDTEKLFKMLGIESFDDFLTLELKADGKASMLAMGEDPDEGTWKQDGDKVTITVDDESNEFTFKGNELTGKFEEDGETHEYVFVKK